MEKKNEERTRPFFCDVMCNVSRHTYTTEYMKQGIQQERREHKKEKIHGMMMMMLTIMYKNIILYGCVCCLLVITEYICTNKDDTLGTQKTGCKTHPVRDSHTHEYKLQKKVASYSHSQFG